MIYDFFFDLFNFKENTDYVGAGTVVMCRPLRLDIKLKFIRNYVNITLLTFPVHAALLRNRE